MGERFVYILSMEMKCLLIIFAIQPMLKAVDIRSDSHCGIHIDTKRLLFEDIDLNFDKLLSCVRAGFCHRDSHCPKVLPECPALCTYHCHGSCRCTQDTFNGQYNGEQGFTHISQTYSFQEALELCQQNNLRLLRIDSDEKLKRVQAFISKSKGYISSTNFRGYWIDKKRSGNDGHYYHNDQSKSPYLLFDHHNITFDLHGDCIDVDVCSGRMKTVQCQGNYYQSGVICEEQCEKQDDCASEQMSCPLQNRHCVDNTCQCEDTDGAKNDTSSAPSPECWKSGDCKGKQVCNNDTIIHCIDGKCVCQYIDKLDSTKSTTQKPTDKPDACDKDPCIHGFCISAVNSAHICLCDQGYTGTICDTVLSVSPSTTTSTPVPASTLATATNVSTTEINRCTSAPCLNDATCEDVMNGFLCRCKPGFSGRLCEKDINECDSNPCHNGARCNDEINAFYCECPLGYSGQFCEQNIDDCITKPCRNGGTCTDGINSYNCSCQPGFTGTRCETEINECSSSPCKNGGTCIDKINAFSCNCKQGFSGTYCNNALCVTDYDCTSSNTVAYGPFGSLPCTGDNMRICKHGTCTCNATLHTSTKPSTTTSSTSIAPTTHISTTQSSGHSCYQCGDIGIKDPCSMQFVVQGTPSPCRQGAYCQTDIYTDIYGNKEIYKRCVSEQTCLHEWLQQSSDKEYCVRYGNVHVNQAFLCSFCCEGNDCNEGLIPKNGTLYGSQRHN